MNAPVRGLKARTWLAGIALLTLAGFVAFGALAGSADDKTPSKQKASSAQVERATSYAKSLSAAFRAAADEVLPSVVMIRNTPKAVQEENDAKSPDAKDLGRDNPMKQFEGTPFEDMFRNQPELRKFFDQMPRGQMSPHRGTPFRGMSVGSGVIIDTSGVILTNNHVVEGGGDILVQLHDGRQFKAVDVKTDPRTDLAIVRIKADDLKAAKLGNSDAAEVGDWVLAVGDPFNLQGTVTAGIVSAKGRGIGILSAQGGYEDFIQTDAAINPGNSGGPLVNLDGEVVGINTAINSRSGGNQGVGFAVPINMAKWVSTELAKHGSVRRAYLGVGIQKVTPELAKQFGMKQPSGAAVTEVFEKTPGAQAGLKPNDVILSFDGKPVRTPQELQLRVQQAPVDAKSTLLVLRDGKEMKLSANLREQPKDFGLASYHDGSSEKKPEPKAMPLDKLGIGCEALTPQVAEQLGVKVKQGVVITDVHAGGLADQAGLETGMVIVEAGRKPVKSPEDLQKLVNDEALQKGLLLLVRTPRGSTFVVVRAQ